MSDRRVLGALLAVLVLAGCGASSSSGPTTSAPKGSYRQQVSDCLHNIGYKTSDAGNALRVQRPTGDLIANVQTFKDGEGCGAVRARPSG